MSDTTQYTGTCPHCGHTNPDIIERDFHASDTTYRIQQKADGTKQAVYLSEGMPDYSHTEILCGQCLNIINDDYDNITDIEEALNPGYLR